MSGNLDDLGFNAAEVEPNSFDVLPAGEYEVAITDSVRDNTKAGTGQYLQIEMQVLSGQFRGRKLFDRLNIVNPSAKAQEIARAKLSSICRAVGVLTPKHSGELHDKPLRVKAVIKTDPQYGPQNKIAEYHPANGAAVSATAAPLAPPAGGPPPNDEIPF